MDILNYRKATASDARLLYEQPGFLQEKELIAFIWTAILAIQAGFMAIVIHFS